MKNKNEFNNEMIGYGVIINEIELVSDYYMNIVGIYNYLKDGLEVDKEKLNEWCIEFVKNDGKFVFDFDEYKIECFIIE